MTTRDITDLSVEEKAVAAQAIFDNPIFRQVFFDIEKNIQELWKKTNAKDMEEREGLWLSLKMLYKLEGQIREHVTTYLINKRTEETS